MEKLDDAVSGIEMEAKELGITPEELAFFKKVRDKVKELCGNAKLRMESAPVERDGIKYQRYSVEVPAVLGDLLLDNDTPIRHSKDPGCPGHTRMELWNAGAAKRMESIAQGATELMALLVAEKYFPEEVEALGSVLNGVGQSSVSFVPGSSAEN